MVPRVHGRIRVPQKPLVGVIQPLAQRRVRREFVRRWAVLRPSSGHDKRCLRRRVHIVPFIQFALEIRNPDHDGEVLPHIFLGEFEGFADGAWGGDLGARDLAILDAQDALALQGVEVLGEGAAEGAEVVALDDQGEQGVDFVEGVEDAEEVARVAVGGDGEDIAD